MIYYWLSLGNIYGDLLLAWPRPFCRASAAEANPLVMSSTASRTFRKGRVEGVVCDQAIGFPCSDPSKVRQAYYRQAQDEQLGTNVEGRVVG